MSFFNMFKIQKGKRVLKAEKSGDYTKASYLLADEIKRLGEQSMRKVEAKRDAIDFPAVQQTQEATNDNVQNR